MKSAEEEKCLQLELESQKTYEIKQAYETLLEVNYKLQSENEDLKSKVEENIKAIRQEYEKKLDRLKAKMVSIGIAEVERGDWVFIVTLMEVCYLWPHTVHSYISLFLFYHGFPIQNIE